MRELDNIHYIDLNIIESKHDIHFFESWIKLRNQQDIHVEGYINYSKPENDLIYIIDESYIDKIFTILNIVESNIF
jgi:hypothetical protein